MSTSGVFQSHVDLTIECDCGYEGDVEATEDREDLTIWWTCPGCGHPEQERLGASTPALCLLVFGFILMAAPLVSLFTMPATLTHLYVTLTGTFLMIGILTLGLLNLIQKGHHS